MGAPDEIIMVKDEIAELNKDIEAQPGTFMSNLGSLPNVYSKSKLIAMIDQEVPVSQLYVDGKLLSQRY